MNRHVAQFYWMSDVEGGATWGSCMAIRTEDIYEQATFFVEF